METRYLDVLKDWNFWENEIDTGVVRRSHVDKLEWYNEFQEVIAISGVRRCGKSTILRQLIADLHKKKRVPYRNTLHINFEDPRLEAQKLDANDLFKLFEEYKNNLKPRGKIYVFLDEVQKVGRWEQFVRALYDLHDRKNDLKFYVTGSNSTVFTSKLATALTGRIMNYHMAPLSYREFCDFGGKNIKDYLKFGGFPKVVLEKDESRKREVLISYYEVILETDVISRNDLKNKEKIRELTSYLLANSGNLVSSYSLEKMLGVGDADISKYIDYFQEAYLFSKVPMFSYSVRKQIYNPDKIYCVDTGLATIAGFNFSENFGRLLENIVHNELKHRKEELFYYKGKQEVDFAVFFENKVSKLINVTATVDDDEVLKRELGALEEAGKEYPEAQQILLTLYNQSGQKDPRIVSLLDFLLL